MNDRALPDSDHFIIMPNGTVACKNTKVIPSKYAQSVSDFIAAAKK